MQYGLDAAHAGDFGSGVASDSDCVVETQLHRAPGEAEIRAAEAPRRRWPLWLARGGDVAAWVAIGWTVASILSGCGSTAPDSPRGVDPAACAAAGAACAHQGLLACPIPAVGADAQAWVGWSICLGAQATACAVEVERACTVRLQEETP